jgi:hypothetical protein
MIRKDVFIDIENDLDISIEFVMRVLGYQYHDLLAMDCFKFLKALDRANAIQEKRNKK